MDMKDCPFAVTVTGMPKVMAGREEEKNDLAAAVDNVFNPSDRQLAATIIFGPRGSGKTSMMHWLMKEAGRMGKGGGGCMDVFHFPRRKSLELAMADPAGFHPSRPSLAARLRGMIGRRRSLAPVSSEKGAEIRFTIPAFVDLFMHYNRKTAVRDHDEAASVQEDPTARLIQRCREKPLLILIDEAHTMSADFKKELASLAYDMTYDGTAGFHLVLAGTPRVNRWKGFDEISFGERYRRMPIGALDLESAMHAIAEPFAWHDITVDEKALTAIADDSHGYPTFIQMWGMELWRAAKAPGAPLTMDDMEEAKERVDKLRAGFYGRRIGRIQETQDSTAYLAAHYAAASAMEESSRALARPSLERAVGAALPPAGSGRPGDDAKEMLERLEDADFVWMPHDMFVPGVPSFMSYVTEYVRMHEPKMAADIDRRLAREFGSGGGG